MNLKFRYESLNFVNIRSIFYLFHPKSWFCIRLDAWVRDPKAGDNRNQFAKEDADDDKWGNDKWNEEDEARKKKTRESKGRR